MVTVREWSAGLLRPRGDDDPGGGTAEAVWVDLVAPTEEERSGVEARSGITLPGDDEIVEIEASSRHFEDGALHLRSLFMAGRDVPPRLVPVAFQVESDRLFTLRAEPLAAFDTYVAEAGRTTGLARDPLDIVLRLFEAKVDRMADALERLLAELERRSEAGRAGPSGSSVEEAVSAVGVLRDTNDRVRLVLMEDDRALSFLLRRGLARPEHESLLREILRDVESLDDHSSYLVERIDALLMETLARIDIEQSRIVKIFSVMAVVLLPPTLIASLYGMNFRFMPELGWRWGYPVTLLAMVLSGLLPFLWFKRKHWL